MRAHIVVFIFRLLRLSPMVLLFASINIVFFSLFKCCCRFIDTLSSFLSKMTVIVCVCGVRVCVCCNIACISAAMRLIFFLYDLVIVIINMSWPVSELPMKGHTIHCLKWHLNASLSRSNIFYGPASSSILSNPSVFTNSRIFKRRRKKTHNRRKQ